MTLVPVETPLVVTSAHSPLQSKSMHAGSVPVQSWFENVHSEAACAAAKSARKTVNAARTECPRGRGQHRRAAHETRARRVRGVAATRRYRRRIFTPAASGTHRADDSDAAAARGMRHAAHGAAHGGVSTRPRGGNAPFMSEQRVAPGKTRTRVPLGLQIRTMGSACLHQLRLISNFKVLRRAI